jgi:hypothetical protein
LNAQYADFNEKIRVVRVQKAFYFDAARVTVLRFVES